MRFPFTARQLAQRVWTYVGVASRTVTASVVSDKTDYLLAATSRAAVLQRVEGVITINNPNTQVTHSLGVTVVKANTRLRFLGGYTTATTLDGFSYIELLNTQNVRATRGTTSAASVVSFELTETHG